MKAASEGSAVGATGLGSPFSSSSAAPSRAFPVGLSNEEEDTVGLSNEEEDR